MVKQLILETERLRLRTISEGDAEFILRLLNEPSFLENIGDRQVRSLKDARRYIREGPIASYKRFGFGLWLVELKENCVPLGICGLLKRDSLEEIDLGYAFLPEYWSQGFAREAAAATLHHASHRLEARRVLAITNPENQSSIRVLEKLGFLFQGLIKLGDDKRDTSLFAVTL